MAWIARRKMLHQVGDGRDLGRQDKFFPRCADAFAQPGEIQDRQRPGGFHHPAYLGVGMVSIEPSDLMIVLVPLPFGTTMAVPPPGKVMVR